MTPAEIAKTFINGNRADAIRELNKGTRLKAARLALDVLIELSNEWPMDKAISQLRSAITARIV